jgi:hypothetical protein
MATVSFKQACGTPLPTLSVPYVTTLESVMRRAQLDSAAYAVYSREHGEQELVPGSHRVGLGDDVFFVLPRSSEEVALLRPGRRTFTRYRAAECSCTLRRRGATSLMPTTYVPAASAGSSPAPTAQPTPVRDEAPL